MLFCASILLGRVIETGIGGTLVRGDAVGLNWQYLHQSSTLNGVAAGTQDFSRFQGFWRARAATRVLTNRDRRQTEYCTSVHILVECAR